MLCAGVHCKELTAPGNGTIDFLGDAPQNMMGSVAEFDCDENFRLDGVESLICLPSGDWSHDAPKCESMECEEDSIKSELIIQCVNNTL